jgi:hypothetical protein
VYITSSLDDKEYLVRNTSHRVESANTLARLNKKISTFISRLENVNNPNFSPFVKRLRSRYNPNSLSEGLTNDPELTSYTLNKEHVTLCLRTRDEKDELYDDSVLFPVILHELAHVGSLTTSHNDEFYKNEDYLKKEAMKFGMYKPLTEQVNYCGIFTQL